MSFHIVIGMIVIFRLQIYTNYVKQRNFLCRKFQKKQIIPTEPDIMQEAYFIAFSFRTR